MHIKHMTTEEKQTIDTCELLYHNYAMFTVLLKMASDMSLCRLVAINMSANLRLDIICALQTVLDEFREV